MDQPPGVTLMVGSYCELNDERVSEYAAALQRNLDCPDIERVILWIEEDAAAWDAWLTAGEAIGYKAIRQALEHPKLTRYDFGRRMLFQDAFRYGNEHLTGKLAALANADIYFDDTLGRVRDLELGNTMLAITRWEAWNNSHPSTAGFQDSWIWQAPLAEFPSDWELGRSCCEARLAHEAQRAGVRILNPAYTIRTTHLHASGVRHYSQIHGTKRVPGPYAWVGPCDGWGNRPVSEDPARVSGIRMRMGRRPSTRRGAARLMHVDRATKEITHHRFEELPDLVGQHPVYVNDSKLRNSRLTMYADSGQQVDVILLDPLGPNRWEAQLRCSELFTKPGAKLWTAESVAAVIVERSDFRWRILEFEEDPSLDRIARATYPVAHLEPGPGEAERYESVYARAVGSLVAGTAGVNITQTIYDRLKPRHLTLHAGSAAVTPMNNADSKFGRLRPERYTMATPPDGPAVAVGTSVVRALESHARHPDGPADVFISGPFKFMAVDALLTGFHLPGTPDLVLLESFLGPTLMLRAYQAAASEGYQFSGYGDSIFVDGSVGQ